jgi:hypothetical protein
MPPFPTGSLRAIASEKYDSGQGLAPLGGGVVTLNRRFMPYPALRAATTWLGAGLTMG